MYGHNHAVRRHRTGARLAGRAVVDARALAEEHAHADHAVVADDETFDDLRARTDEAVVLDDRRRRLQRLQHAADARAAGDVAVLADLRTGADSGPGVDHRSRPYVRAAVDERRQQPPALPDETAAAP